MRMVFRPATPADIAAFHDGQGVPWSLRGEAVEIDGELVGVGGVYYCDGAIAVFSARKPDVLRPREILLCAKRVMAMVDRIGAPVMACAERTREAVTTLRHFGFAQLENGYWGRS